MKKKTIRKMIYLIAAFLVAVPALAWIYANYFLELDTSEVDSYYSLLSKYEKPADALVIDVGVKENDSLQLAANRLKSVMGLGMCNVSLSYNNIEKPPAYITDDGKYNLQISLSNSLKGKKEQIGVLVHELSHAYVTRLDKSVFSKCDQERLVDCTGVFLGLGALVLNGLTDDFLFTPGGYETERKFFGYIKPEQFGYLFARYSVEGGIPANRVMGYLKWAGKKYFTVGLNYLKRRGDAFMVSDRIAKAAYWCRQCGSLIRSSFNERIRGARCPKCGVVINF